MSGIFYCSTPCRCSYPGAPLSAVLAQLPGMSHCCHLLLVTHPSWACRWEGTGNDPPGPTEDPRSTWAAGSPLTRCTAEGAEQHHTLTVPSSIPGFLPPQNSEAWQCRQSMQWWGYHDWRQLPLPQPCLEVMHGVSHLTPGLLWGFTGGFKALCRPGRGAKSLQQEPFLAPTLANLWM